MNLPDREKACEESNRGSARAILDIWPVASAFQRELARRTLTRIGTDEDRRRLEELDAKEEKAVNDR